MPAGSYATAHLLYLDSKFFEKPKHNKVKALIVIGEHLGVKWFVLTRWILIWSTRICWKKMSWIYSEKFLDSYNITSCKILRHFYFVKYTGCVIRFFLFFQMRIADFAILAQKSLNVKLMFVIIKYKRCFISSILLENVKLILLFQYY